MIGAMTGPRRAKVFLIATLYLVVGPPAARAQHELATPRTIARAVARVSTEFASQQPAIDTAWLDAVATLPVGADMRATIEEGPAVRGTFVAVDAESLTLWVDCTERRLLRHEIRRLAMSKGTRQRRHESIGLIAGAVLGALLMERRCKGQSTSSACYEEAMLYFGGPMIAGGGIGHFLPKSVAWRDIYVRRP
jgi:hypothetical protein